jgi:cyclopropane fatty-acyl-phospholipid synthase-like methyltransferase
VDDLIRPERYPRSSACDPAWVLGLGSGRGATSVFPAREFGVRVVAADWWIAPEEAPAVFAGAGVGDQVEAVRAEAHALPFEEESFDAIVSVDAFGYFGTADGYLPYLAGFLRPGGQLGMATPGMTREVRELGAIPPHIKALVGWEALAWHTAGWWRFQEE